MLRSVTPPLPRAGAGDPEDHAHSSRSRAEAPSERLFFARVFAGDLAQQGGQLDYEPHHRTSNTDP